MRKARHPGAGLMGGDVIFRLLRISLLAALAMVQGGALYLETRSAAPAAPGPLTRAPWRLSLRTLQADLMRCDNALSYPRSALMPRALLRQSAETCLARARQAIARIPGHGPAHYIAALALTGTDPQGAARHLAQSARAAPRQGWLAQRRFALARALPEEARRGARGLLPSDIPVLLSTEAGARLVAQTYLRRPALRPEITGAAKRTNPEQQARLVSQMRRQASRP
jgi:hypothetical protein